MAHRGLQIINAIATLITDGTASVYKHRALSLDEDQHELPAKSVLAGEDLPLDDDGASNMSVLDSLLAVEVLQMCRGAAEEDVLEKLFAMRASDHAALLAGARDLGLTNCVIDVRYGGAGEPEVVLANESFTGRLSTRWFIHYRMNVSDPS